MKEYHVIFHTSENAMRNGPSIITSMTIDYEPNETEVEKLMREISEEMEECTYAEVYYDKYGNESFDELIYTYTI